MGVRAGFLDEVSSGSRREGTRIFRDARCKTVERHETEALGRLLLAKHKAADFMETSGVDNLVAGSLFYPPIYLLESARQPETP